MRPIIISGGILEAKNMSGIPRYSYEVIKHLDELLERDEQNIDIRIYYQTDRTINVDKLHKIKMCPLERKRKKFRLQVLRKYIKNQNGISCNFANDVQIYRNGIVCVHDMRPLDTRLYDTPKLRREFLCLKYSIKLMNSTVVTVSEYSKKEICRICRMPEDKVHVIPNGWEHITKIEEDVTIFDRLSNVKRENYFYSIGSVARHKNFKWIYEIARRNPEEMFVVAGNIDKSFWKIDISEMKLNNMVFCGYVSDQENKALMQSCKAFLFPSKYEGFGIPPLEALALGKKIIISNATCLPEIFGSSAAYFDPDDYNVDLESMMNQKVEGREKVLEKYTWKNAAKLWMKLFVQMQ